MSPQVEKIIVMLGKLMLKDSISRNDILWTLNDLSNIANGSSLIKNASSFEFSFGKKIKFHQLYQYTKNNRDTETFNSRHAFTKYAKMSVSLQKL